MNRDVIDSKQNSSGLPSCLRKLRIVSSLRVPLTAGETKFRFTLNIDYKMYLFT